MSRFTPKPSAAMPLVGHAVLVALGIVAGSILFSLPVAAQTAIIPLDTLVANHGSVTAGDVTFSNFKKPTVIPVQVGVLLTEFNDVGVSAVVNPDGTVSLNLVFINPSTGLARPIISGPPNGPGEFLRFVSYTVTVTNSALRLHSVAQDFGPSTYLYPSTSGLPYSFLYGVEPGLGINYSVDTLRWDYAQFFQGDPHLLNYQTLLPGGNPSTLTMENQFGTLKGHTGVPSGGSFDSVIIAFTLVPAGTPAPPVVVNLAEAGEFVAPLYGGNVLPNSFRIEPTAGILQFLLTNFAQEGGATIALTSSNSAALPLPPSVTVQQGNYLSPPLFLGPANLDFPTTVTLTASFNGRTQTQDFVAKPATPLAVAFLWAATLTCGGQPCTLSTWMRVQVQLNRANVSPETITLTSSNPAICPIQPVLSVPAFSALNALPVLDITCKAVAVDTPITYTATLNGVTTTYTATLFKSTDNVAITRAELVVKNLSLKVDAINQVPADVLTLYNAVTGQQIGVMTYTGLSGTGGKYSFQGTIAAPVTTLLLRSGLNGSTTFTVSQK